MRTVFVRRVFVSVLAFALALPLLASDPADAAGPRPEFLLPFPCDGVGWRALTYATHDHVEGWSSSDLRIIDFNRADSSNSRGEPVVAAAGGRVTTTPASAPWAAQFGAVEIDHGDGWKTRYAHMQNVSVAEGREVAAGQQIGEVGDVGAPDAFHLHFEILADDALQDPSFGGEAVVWGPTQTIGSLADLRLSQTFVSNNCGDSPVVRLSSLDRFGTAVEISQRAFPEGATVVYIADGLNFPDALAGGVAAAREAGPVLLTSRDSLPHSVEEELSRLKPDEIVLLGGAGAVPDNIRSELSQGFAPVRRLAGDDRYETAAKVANDTFRSPSTVFVASGSSFPDALAATPVAAKLNAPLLLTHPTRLPQVTADTIVASGATRVVILGGPGAVSEDVAAALTALRGVDAVERWYGQDRFATAVKISQMGWSTTAATVYVANGLNFPDALAGGVSAFVEDAPVLLVQPGAIPASTLAELRRLQPRRIVVLGGAGAVSPSVAVQLEALIAP